MKKSWNLIPKIISGEKTIESRWYRARRAPWDRIKPDETVFFKNSGELVIAKAIVSEVVQFEIKNIGDALSIMKKYGKEICLINKDPYTWGTLPKYSYSYQASGNASSAVLCGQKMIWRDGGVDDR